MDATVADPEIGHKTILKVSIFFGDEWALIETEPGQEGGEDPQGMVVARLRAEVFSHLRRISCTSCGVL
jgi:hypothetical protein